MNEERFKIKVLPRFLMKQWQWHLSGHTKEES